MRLTHLKSIFSYSVLLALAGTVSPVRAEGGFIQHNLVSDLPGMTDHTDKSLVNAWGIDHSPAGPGWVNANGTGKSIVYDGSGNPATAAKPIVVAVPNAPTGIVFNGSMDFQLGPAQPAFFLFATEDGTISGWNPGVDPANA